MGEIVASQFAAQQIAVARNFAKSNAEQVTKIRGILENLSLQIATPAEARAMLKLKGGDQVGF